MDADAIARNSAGPGVSIDALRSVLETTLGRPVALVETHISWILLDGEHAWKVKKPVTLGFLDFARLEMRRACCEAEVRLNRRLAPEIYLDVVAIHGTPQAPRLEGDGPPIDHAVRMRQFPAGALFSERLAAGALDVDTVERFARRLARFHREAPAADAAVPWGDAERVRADTALALDGIAAAAPSSASWVAGMRERFEAQALRLRPVLEERKREGWIREGHGDLHLANVVVLDAQVTAFDCIEFDPGLRWIDVQNDAAFLAMDLLAHDRPDLAYRFLDVWLGELGDYGGARVLRYYLAYRALVRELVASIRRGQAGDDDGGPRYGALASRLVDARDARLLVTCGVSGSGKSHVSQRLLGAAGAIRLRSDLERKRLHGVGALERTRSGLDAGLYAADASQRTYARLLELARVTLEAGWPTIVDATFLRASDRSRFRALAERCGVPFTILHCDAAEPVLRARIASRRLRGADPSDADESVLARQLATREALSAEERRFALEVDTADAVDAAGLAREWLARR